MPQPRYHCFTVIGLNFGLPTLAQLDPRGTLKRTCDWARAGLRLEGEVEFDVRYGM